MLHRKPRLSTTAPTASTANSARGASSSVQQSAPPSPARRAAYTASAGSGSAQPSASSARTRRRSDTKADTSTVCRLAGLCCALQLLAAGAQLLPSFTLPPSVTLRDGESHPYIVVGAGAAGAAAAARLALAGRCVLLIEAGGDPDLISRIPSAAMVLLGSKLDWKYATVPNNVSCLASRGRRCQVSRGKCLGGSTSINYMLYTRGNRRDYDDYGVPGWTWRDLKRYFLRYEGLNPSVLRRFPASSKPYHNTSGIMKLELFADPENPWQERIIEGFNGLGFDTNPDVNGATQIGVTRNVGYVYDDERMSTARAYLGDERTRTNLKIAKNAYCTGVIFNDDKVAIGITVVQGSTSKRIYAEKEIILSAGAIETPKILLLSGVGPADHLTEIGIPVVSDLPVGQNMSDHVLPLLIVQMDPEEGAVESTVSLVGDVTEFLLSGGGPAGSIGVTDVTAFFNTSCYARGNRSLTRRRGCELPNIQVIHAYVSRGLVTVGKSVFQNSVNLNDDVIEQIAEINSKKPIMIVSTILLTPYSRGYVKLAGRDPLVQQEIFPNYLDDDRDLDQIVRAIAVIEDLMRTPPFRRRNAKLSLLKLPGCLRPAAGRATSAYWRCYARHMTFSVFHAMGTCALRAVVDTELRVRGVRRVRVADASVYPVVVRGTTAAASIAAGERVADFILGRD